MSKAIVQVNRARLAESCDVALTTVDSWRRAGCPVVRSGGSGKEVIFNLPEVIAWLRDTDVKAATGETAQSEDALKLRKLEAETIKAELDLAKERKEVAPLELMSGMMSHVFSQVRAGIRNLPTRCVSQLIGETDPRRFKTIMLEEIDLVLTALADADLTDGYVEENDNGGDGEQ